MGTEKQGFGDRDYRLLQLGNDLKYFNVKVKETDLAIGVENKVYSDSLISLCYKETIKIRRQLEEYILSHPQFQTSLVPIKTFPEAPEIAVKMAAAAAVAGVGPMAAVAGAVADYIGQILEQYSPEVIVENGGDIYLKSARERNIAIYAGESPFSYKIGFKVKAGEKPAGICTSSGTVGHSLSFGVADAVVIKGSSAILADAVATQAGNLVKNKFALERAIEYVKKLDRELSIVAIKDDQMMAWGDIEMIPL
ncbi:MAG: UPF0280 family protein [Syntrophomonadaceae bacterium]|nr:UPF0280 family protein [Syntrophomonadaceae bacterium]